MVNVGIDFGSTYTLISIYREDMRILETINLDQGSPYIPSVVALDSSNNFEVGKAAKSRTGKRGVKIYKAFKMLLTENENPKQLEIRGFDKENTPQKISSIFLENVFRMLLNNIHEDRIGKLVVGIPEIWNTYKNNVDARSIIQDIFKEFKFIDKVQIVSEPAAASAYFAYNFYLSEKINFNGNILLIDYGGGTLDITLNNVIGDKESVEIKVLERKGSGENEQGKIGKAGVLYMETVMEKAILKSSAFKDLQKVEFDSKFYKAVDDFEEEMQARTSKIEEIFEEYEQAYQELEDIEFTNIEYKGQDILITYALLLEVYNDIIRDELDSQLTEIINFMIKNNINYMGGSDDKFKIALAGGFGNFYLVKKQVIDKFSISTYDRRTEGIVKNKSDCIKAISLGAALLANDIIGIRYTAPYSIGLPSYLDNKTVNNYAIKFRQDIEIDKIYYITDKDNNKILFRSLSGNINKFITDDNGKVKELVLKKEFAEKLKSITKNNYHIFAVGFSIDQSEIISLHISDYDILNDKFDLEDRAIELAKFNDLFEV